MSQYTFIRLISISTIIIFTTACFHEDSVEDKFPSHADRYFSNGPALSPITEEEVLASYKGEIDTVLLSAQKGCDDLKERLVSSWENKLSNSDDGVCYDCGRYASGISHSSYSKIQSVNESGINQLIVNDDQIIFADKEDIHFIQLDENGQMNDFIQLPVDYHPISLFENSTLNTMTVLGASTNNDSSKMIISLIDIQDTSAPTEIERYAFNNSHMFPLDIQDGKVTLVSKSEINLPDELTSSQEFRELSENYADAKRLKELYDYAVEKTEDTIPDELLDMQEGASVLVDVYKQLFNASFDSVVGNLNELLPTIEKTLGEETTEDSLLACNDIFSSDEETPDNNYLTQVIELNFAENVNNRSLGIFGAYDVASTDSNHILLVKNEYYGDLYGESGKTTLARFVYDENLISFASSIQIHGNSNAGLIYSENDLVYMLSTQMISNNDYHFDGMGMVNFLVLKYDETGYQKIAEEPGIMRTWGPYVDAQSVFMKESLYLVDRTEGREVVINYEDPENIGVSSKELNNYIYGVRKIDDTRLLLAMEDHGKDFRRKLRLINVNETTEVLSELNDNNYYDISYDMTIVKSNIGLLLGLPKRDFHSDSSGISSDLHLLSIDENNTLSKNGVIKHKIQRDENSTCNNGDINSAGHDGHTMGMIECDMFYDHGYYTAPWPSLADIATIEGTEYVVSYMGSEVKTSQLESLANSSTLTLSH